MNRGSFSIDFYEAQMQPSVKFRKLVTVISVPVSRNVLLQSFYQLKRRRPDLLATGASFARVDKTRSLTSGRTRPVAAVVGVRCCVCCLIVERSGRSTSIGPNIPAEGNVLLTTTV